MVLTINVIAQSHCEGRNNDISLKKHATFTLSTQLIRDLLIDVPSKLPGEHTDPAAITAPLTCQTHFQARPVLYEDNNIWQLLKYQILVHGQYNVTLVK